MSETITLECTEDIAVEDQPTEFDVFAMEAAVADEEVARKQWGDELEALVRANEEVKVICPWMDGAEVTLTIAMTTYDYGPNPTEADVPVLISVVNELLASRKIAEDLKEEEEVEEEVVTSEKKEEPQESKTTQIKEPDKRAEVKVSEVEIDLKTTKEQRRSQQVTNAAYKSEIPSAREEKPPQPETIVKILSNTSYPGSKPPASGQNSPVARQRNSSYTSSHQTNFDSKSSSFDQKKRPWIGSKITTLKPVVDVRPMQIFNSKSEFLEREIVINRKKIEAEQQAETPRITEIKPQTASIFEEHPVSGEAQIAVDQGPGPSTQPSSVEVSAESEYTTPNDEVVKVIENQPPLITSNYQINTSGPEDSGLEDFRDEEITTDHFEVSLSETISFNSSIKEAPTLQADDTLKFSAETTAIDLEQPAEVGLTTEQIENSLTLLEERIKESGSQTMEMANEYIDKIIQVTLRLEAPNSEGAMIEVEDEEELEELFTELFDLVGISYTPELIDYLVHQTPKWHLVDEIEKLKNEQAIDEVPQDDAIHMMIKKLIASLKTLKRSIAHYCAIGKVALVLCRFNTQFKPRRQLI